MATPYFIHILVFTCIAITITGVKGQCPANITTTCTQWQTCNVTTSMPVCICMDGDKENDCDSDVFTFTTDDNLELYPYEGDSIVLNVTVTAKQGYTVYLLRNGENSSFDEEGSAAGEDKGFAQNYTMQVKMEDEGSNFTFIAVKEENQNITAGIVFTITHVYSTILTATSPIYQVNEGGGVELTLTASTESSSWENITINVTKPDGSNDSITINSRNDANESANITYLIQNANLTTDLGNYVFEAIEGSVPADSPKTETITVISIIINSNLPGNETVYTTVREEKRNVTCVVLGDAGTILWLNNDSEVSGNEADLVYQEDGIEKERLLIFDQDVPYSAAGAYTCKFNESLEKTLNIIIEGKPEISLTWDSNQTYSCKVEGLPMANITWKISDQDVNEANRSNENSYTTESTFVISSPLCLSNEMLTCQAINKHGDDSSATTINEDDVIGISQERYIFFPNETANYNFANTSCINKGGNLVIVADNIILGDITQLADNNKIQEFYVGATKQPDGNWSWWNNEPVDPIPVKGDVAKSCAVLNLTEAKWTLTAVNCKRPQKYACQVTADSYPKDLKVMSDECNGGKLRLTWTPAESGIYQEITYSSINSTVLKKNVTNDTASDILTGLSQETEYTVQITTIQNDMCVLHPYTLRSNTTSILPAIAVTDQSMTLVNGNICNITWEYSDENNDIQKIYIGVNESVSDTYTDSADPKITIYNTDENATHYEVSTNPNSKYTVNIMTENQCGNSSVTATNGCITEFSEPFNIPVPEGKKTGSTGISMTIPGVDNRNGIVSCQFLVGRYMKESEGTNETTNNGMNETTFLTIKQDGDDIEEGNEFFVFAQNGSDTSHTLPLGDGTTKSRCIPLPVKNARRRRDLSPGTEIKAISRSFVGNARYKYYTITTTPSRNGSLVFYGRSDFSLVYQITEAPSSNAAVIVLSILLVIIVIAIAFFFIRRRMSKGKRMIPNITFGVKRKAFQKEADYEIL